MCVMRKEVFFVSQVLAYIQQGGFYRPMLGMPTFIRPTPGTFYI